MPAVLNHLQWWEVQTPSAPDTGVPIFPDTFAPWMPILTTTFGLIIFVWLGA